MEKFFTDFSVQPKSKSKTIILSVIESSSRSVDIYYKFLPGSCELMKTSAAFCIYECDDDGGLKSPYKFRINLSQLTTLTKVSDKITISNNNIKDLEFKKGNLYAIGLCVGDGVSEYTIKDLINICYFWHDSPDEDIMDPQNTKIELLTKKEQTAIYVKFNIPKNTLSGGPENCYHLIRLYDSKSNDLFDASNLKCLCEVPVDTNLREGMIVLPKNYSDLRNNAYCVAYCHKDTIPAGLKVIVAAADFVIE